MRMDLGAKVRTSDGRDAGRIERAVYDPDTQSVTKFLVSTGGLLGYEVLVPREDLERATTDGDVVVLDLTKEQLESMEQYVSERYAPPSIGWVPTPGVGWAYPPDAYVLPPAQEGPKDIGGVPIRKGSPVVDRDGEDVGIVEELQLDPKSGRVERFVLKVGGTLERLFGAADTVEIPPTGIASVEAGTVKLRAGREELIGSER